jgi:hypothetical protein
MCCWRTASSTAAAAAVSSTAAAAALFPRGVPTVVVFLVAVVTMSLVVAVVAPKATTVEAVRMFGAVFEKSVVVAVAAGMVGAAVALAAPFERRRGRKET